MKRNSRQRGFAGGRAVVTGGSSGIGRAIALALAEAGVARQLIQYRANRQGAEETSRLVAAAGGEAQITACDLSVAGDRQRLIDTAFDQLGVIQTWVNNAGADVLTGEAAALGFDHKLRRLIEVDVLGTIDLSRQVVERWKSQTSAAPPSLVFIGWDQALEGMEGDAGQMFAAAKAAVMGFAASLAQDVAPAIRVNTVAPGWIRTSWGETSSEYWNRRAQAQALMQRWGSPADVARAVIYAAHPENTFCTGQTIAVNGGFSRRY